VSPSKPVKRGPEPTEAQWRVINAALKLFAERGVGGTSLRMIAKELGVTVAAVYHQFHTKDEIIFAAAASQLRRLEAVVDAAEAEPTAEGAREALITGMVDLTVGGVGRQVSAFLSDPIISGSFARDARFLELVPRMRHLLMGDETTGKPRIRTATLIAALNGAAIHPLVKEFDDATLRRELLLVAHFLLPPLRAAEAGSPSPGR
jgi:AcrR family transcriptional regulator